MAPFLDAVAHHPYQYPNRPTSPEPTNVFLQTERIHDLMVSFGDGAKQIWGTEVGAPTRGALGERGRPGRVAARVLRRLERLGVHRTAALVHRA